MNINGYNKKNKYCFKNKKCNYFNNNCNKKFNFQNLFEVEHFLCNFKNACKSINLYKFLK